MALDRRLRDEFQRTAEAAPATVSPDAMTAVVDRAGHIRRNRRVAVAGSVLAVLAIVALVSVPHLTQTGLSVVPGTPTPSATRSPLGETLTSPRHGYAIDYPSGWTAVAAADASQPDRFRSPTGATISISSEQLAPGQTDDEWVADYLPGAGGARRRDCFPPRDQWLPVDVGGVTGGLLAGDFGCYLTEAVVFVDHRVYVVDAVPELPTGLFDQGLLEQMLASVRFLPPSSSP